MVKKIEFSLSSSSISKAIQDIQQYKKFVSEKSAELTRKLAEIGLEEATLRFAGAYYENGNDVKVTVETTNNGWVIRASGEAVTFIEFGAGVYYNGAEPHPKRPPKISKIGEYGQGKGKQNTWGYYNDSGDLVLTHGTKAEMPMNHAYNAMTKEISRIVAEVFG